MVWRVLVFVLQDTNGSNKIAIQMVQKSALMSTRRGMRAVLQRGGQQCRAVRLGSTKLRRPKSPSLFDRSDHSCGRVTWLQTRMLVLLVMGLLLSRRYGTGEARV
jgi:hypothetical protein